MGIFGQSSPFDADVEKATSETNTNDNWSFILDVCDKVSTNPRLAKDCLKAVMRRMGHADPHVVMQAITLLDACANNCGKPFHLEIASRDFETEFRRLLSKAQPKVSLKMRQVLKSWAESDFKNDPELNLIPTLYGKLRSEGYDFSSLSEKSSGKSAAAKAAAASLAKDPNVVSSQQEEDDIAKAIELSLKETKGSPKQQSSGGQGVASSATNTSSAYPSLYPSFGTNGGTSSTAAAAAPSASARTVRALYDFEAAEENELTFFAGEIIQVLDDSDANWWKGYNDRGEGLFPSNFVTADLSVDPERLDINQQHKQATQPTAAQEQKTEAAAPQPVEINEAKIDRLLHLLHEANPEDPSQDSEEMIQLEQQVHQMGPLIDAELERVDRKHAQLTQLSSDLVDAINLYHTLMRDDRAAAAQFGPTAGGAYMPGGFPGAALYGAPGYPSAAGYTPEQSYAMMRGLHYMAPPPAAAAQASMPYQNGHVAPPHPQQLNSLPTHLTQAPAAVAGAPNMYQPSPVPNAQQQQQQPPYTNQHLPPVTTHQQQLPQPPTNYQLPLPGEPQQQPQALPPQMPQAPPHPHAYMSPQHQQPQQTQPQQLPPQPQPPYYTPNGHSVNPGYMPAHAQPIPQATHNQIDQFSQLQQQMSALSMAQLGGMPPQAGAVGPGAPAAVAPVYNMQNEAVKNNIPIYQQQR
ncbi:Stam [Drosophila busckii]|uniref:Stam n=1 Tax=Drosophila busckii TaxID=30019 RepID=A0A0M5J3L2_DROBS|nr:signal transducing adapter molecule 1 [Drosophila busckii]XP_017853973.1 signal transducing adapter molecule 1 [Drosophila busckii]ALC38694.1 Stam [Drosophila busckii]